MTNGDELQPDQMPSSHHRETLMAHRRLCLLMRIMARRKNAATERHTIIASAVSKNAFDGQEYQA